jgi:hypothetical protein
MQTWLSHAAHRTGAPNSISSKGFRMSSNHFPPSLFQRCISGGCLALSLLATTPASAAGPDFDPNGRHDPKKCRRPGSEPTPLLQITSPQRGQIETGGSVKISLDVAKHTSADSITLTLNGKDVSSKLSIKSCDKDSCKETARVDTQDGLLDGTNRLRAAVEGLKNGSIETVKSDFRYHKGGKLGATQGVNVEYYTPASVGISTTGNGGAGGTWVSITTGTPANVNDPVQNYPELPGSDDPNNPGVYYTELPYPDVQFPINCPGWNYQAMALDRKNPTIQEGATCVDSEPDMETELEAQLGRPLDDRDLIVFGTTPSNFAFHDLNTSDIGGTDYSTLWKSNPSLYPEYYIILGVKGADAGSAQENYLVSGTWDTPYTYYPTLGGTLMQDGSGNYNYAQSGEKDFQIISGSTPSVQIGWQTYTPPSNSSGLFWLMVFDRMALQPINGYKATVNSTCQYTLASQSCGMLFNVKADGGKLLATALSGVSARNLIVLTAIGCPFDNAGESSSSFANELQNIGGMIHAPVYMNSASSGCNYALMSVNDGNHVAYNSNAALSWSHFSAQSQLGMLHGFITPDRHGIYDVGGKDQMALNSKSNQYIPTVDYAFEHIASQNRTDWPAEDTTDNLAAYHDISNQLLTDPSINEKGPNNYDVRYFYTAVLDGTAYDLTDLIDSRLSSTATNPVKQSSWDTATPAEFNAIRNQILSEFQNLRSSMGYLTGTGGGGGVRGLLNGTNGTVLATATGVASDIGQDLSKALAVNVTTEAVDWINLAAGVVSTLGPALGTAVPGANVFAGVLSGALRTGTAATTPLVGATGNAIPGAGSKYDLTLATLIQNGSKYSTNLLDGYDGAVDNILSDNGKLAAAGALAGNSASGWTIANLGNGDGIANNFAVGARIKLWNDVLPKLYGVRVASLVSSTSPSSWGSEFYPVGSNPVPECLSAYRNQTVGTNTTTIYPDPGNQSKFDVNVLAEEPSWTLDPNGLSNLDYVMSSNLSTLFTTNQQVDLGSGTETGLNIPPMMFTANGSFLYTPAAMYSNQTCKP